MDPQQMAAALATQQQQIADLTTQVQLLQQQLANQRPPSPRRKLSDPVKFSGRFLDVWEPLAKAVLRIDQAAIGDEEAQLYWLFGNLDERVQTMVLPLVTTAQTSEDFKTTRRTAQAAYDLRRICRCTSSAFSRPQRVLFTCQQQQQR